MSWFQRFKQFAKLRKTVIVSWAILAAVTPSLISCGPQFRKKKKQSLITECVLPEDQSASLRGKWSAVPGTPSAPMALPLSLKSGDFTAAEAASIQAGIDTWNAHYGAAAGFQVMVRNADRSNISNPTKSTFASTYPQITNGQTFTKEVMVFKVKTGWEEGSGTIAVTRIRFPSGSPNSTATRFDTAIIDLNYQNFFGQGQVIPDLQSIITHEMGHLLGLRHSCTLAGESELPDCNGDLDPGYYEALLFPSFGVDGAGFGEIKRGLGENDMGRANCLYGPTAL